MKYALFLPCVLLLLGGKTWAADKPSDVGVWDTQRISNFSEIDNDIDPKAGPTFKKKMEEAYGDNLPPLTTNEILAVNAPRTKSKAPFTPDLYEDQVGTPPAKAALRANAEQYLNDYQVLNPASKDLVKALHDRYGVRAWYYWTQIKVARDKGDTQDTTDAPRVSPDPVAPIVRKLERESEARNKTFEGWLDGVQMPRIRHDWTDVLATEDPSQRDNGKTIKDLVGAKFGYTYDAKAHIDTWTAQGALIFPYIHNLDQTGGLERIALAPSVTINRVDTSGDPKIEADSLLYRVGLYGQCFNNAGTFSVDLRAAGAYATTTGGRGRLPGYEVDLEPRYFSNNLRLGYKYILEKDHSAVAQDGSDISLMDLQIRFWVHLEGGDVQDAGTTWNSVKGTFLRIGPSFVVQYDWRKFSLTGSYSYLPAISGTREHGSYFDVSAAYALVKDDVRNRSISITADYQNGGLALTKEDVNVFSLGLAVKF